MNVLLAHRLGVLSDIFSIQWPTSVVLSDVVVATKPECLLSGLP